jgi:outer membrane protein
MGSMVFGSQTVSATGLIDVLQLAQKNDPALQAALSKKQSIEEHRSQALARLLPSLTGTAELSRTFQDIRSTDNDVFSSGSTDFDGSDYGLNLTQPVFHWDSIVAYKATKVEILRAEAEYQIAVQDLVLRVAEQYMKALAAQDQLHFAKAEQGAIDQHFELADTQFKKGLIPITDMHDAKARKALVNARVIEAESLLDDAMQALREMTAEPVDGLDSLRADIILNNPDPVDAEAWITAAVKQNPAIMLAKHSVDIAGKEIDRQRAAHLPTVDLVGSYNSEDTDGSLYGGGSKIDNTKAMLRLSVPIYQGGMVNSKVAEAEHQRSGAHQEMIRQTMAVERQTRSAFLGVKSALNRVEALKQSVASSQSALEAKQEGFLSGLYTSLAVLDAERDLYLTKQEYAKARYEYLINHLKLKKATDTLSGHDIQQMAQLFQ